MHSFHWYSASSLLHQSVQLSGAVGVLAREAVGRQKATPTSNKQHLPKARCDAFRHGLPKAHKLVASSAVGKRRAHLSLCKCWSDPCGMRVGVGRHAHTTGIEQAVVLHRVSTTVHWVPAPQY